MIPKNRKCNRILPLFIILVMLLPLIICIPTGPIVEIKEKTELQAAGSDTYVVIPLTINKVAGTTVNRTKIIENIRRMNEIYNCEVIIFIWNGTIGVVPDPDGTPDGNISGVGAGGRREIRNNASENAGGSGIGITIAGEIDPNTNGITAVGNGHGAIVRSDTDGNTWAHEVQHALGQSHGPAQNATEDINGAAAGNGTGWDINGDGKINADDMQYNLWGRYSDRANNTLNCTAILDAADDIPGARVKQRPQNVLSPPNTEKKTGWLSDLWDDVFNWTSGLLTDLSKYVDLTGAGIIKDYVSGLMNFWIKTAFIPIVNCTYTYAFNYDPFRGCNNSVYLLDADIIINFLRGPGVDETFFQSWDNDTGDWYEPFPGQPLGPFEVRQMNETDNFHNDSEIISNPDWWVESFFDVMLSLDVPDFHPLHLMLSVVLEGPFEMWVTCEWNDWVHQPFSDETSRRVVTLENLPVETNKISKENVTGTNTIQVNGSNYSPNGNISIYLDGVFMGSVLADGSGSFSTTITLPNISKTNAILHVQDEEGKADATYINIEAFIVIPQPGPIPFGLLPIALVALTLVLFIKSKRKNARF